MLAVDAYYNGTNIVLDRDVEMFKGQRMTVVFEPVKTKRKNIDLDKYGIRTERGMHVNEYMKEMRENDRLS